MGDHRIAVITTILMVAWIPGSLHAVTIDCAPLRPGRAIDATIEDKVKGQANILVRALGSGSIENGYRQVEADTLARYPGADKLLLWREYIYVSCSLIASSSKWSDDDKWMRLMNRWSDEPPDASSTKNPQPSQPVPSTNGPAAMPATEQRPIVGGIALGAGLAEIQSRRDIRLSLDTDGNPYGEEVFTFAYGLPPARHLDGSVVFGMRDNAVDSITVTHILGSDGSCTDSATAGMILNQEVHEWGAPLQRVVSQGVTGKDDETKSYIFRRGSTNMVLVLQTSAGPICRVSMNYQIALSGNNLAVKR